jgi:hypothetical protein
MTQKMSDSTRIQPARDSHSALFSSQFCSVPQIPDENRRVLITNGFLVLGLDPTFPDVVESIRITPKPYLVLQRVSTAILEFVGQKFGVCYRLKSRMPIRSRFW